jgi:hypothetical protein
VLEQVGAGVGPAGFFRAGHGVRADEMAVSADGEVAEAADLALHAAHVGDEGAGGEVGGDLLDQRDDAVHGRGDDDQVGALDRGLGRVGDGVAPRLPLSCRRVSGRRAQRVIFLAAP